MTWEQYMGRRAAHEVERIRVRGILDQHAAWMALGIIRPDAPLIQKTLNDLADITRRGAELDVEFWSALFGDLNA